MVFLIIRFSSELEIIDFVCRFTIIFKNKRRYFLRRLYLLPKRQILFTRKKLRQPLSEREQIAWAKKDQQHFGVLYENYFETIFRFVFKRLGGDEAAAADLTQQTFLKAMMHLHRYEDRGFPFSSWLYRIAQNEVNLFFRKEKQTREIEIQENQLLALFEETDVPNTMTEEDQEKLIACINALEAEQMDLIELRFFQEMSFKEIAAIYDISEANAKMRIYRLIEKIQKQWK
ncbi:MAG: sigma-70 family RNA polymerase sigma factor [Crocinitomicaceae bacterium]|nr:MAG: sigma-70 family RNA polymerase sigma factor [Crocinitomicaceae bacterium]